MNEVERQLEERRSRKIIREELSYYSDVKLKTDARNIKKNLLNNKAYSYFSYAEEYMIGAEELLKIYQEEKCKRGISPLKITRW